MNISSILVAGSVNADLYIEVERLPLAGETLAGENAAVHPGGKGANQAAACAKLGARTRLSANFGNDAYKELLRSALHSAGVDLNACRDIDKPTGQAFILLQKGGENSIILSRGANEVWDSQISFDLKNTSALLLQREIPERVNIIAAGAAKKYSVPAVLDCGGSNLTISAELLKLIDIISPNETELAGLTSLPTETDEQVLAAARFLQRDADVSVLVKLGSRGCLWVPYQGEVIRQNAFKVKAADTTGAGDCFTAAFTVVLAEGLDVQSRLRMACAAAAICVQSPGAMPSMPYRKDVEAFLKQQS